MAPLLSLISERILFLLYCIYMCMLQLPNSRGTAQVGPLATGSVME